MYFRVIAPIIIVSRAPASVDYADITKSNFVDTSAYLSQAWTFKQPPLVSFYDRGTSVTSSTTVELTTSDDDAVRAARVSYRSLKVTVHINSPGTTRSFATTHNT